MYYFASDVHLGAGDEQFSRRTEERFVKWLDTVAEDADTIFLVGDIFDFWFEYGHIVPKGFARTLGKLAELTDRGVKIVMLTGNHDMWARDYLTKECGVELYFAPQTLNIAGKNIFLAHGDNMNIGNMPMLRLMNTVFRSKTMRWLFSWLIHPDLAMRFGKWWSGKSRKSHAKDYIDENSLKFLIDYAEDYKRMNPDVDYVIFGHMHYAHKHNADNMSVIFLGTWEGDKPATYATIDSNGTISLKNF